MAMSNDDQRTLERDVRAEEAAILPAAPDAHPTPPTGDVSDAPDTTLASHPDDTAALLPPIPEASAQWSIAPPEPPIILAADRTSELADQAGQGDAEQLDSLIAHATGATFAAHEASGTPDASLARAWLPTLLALEDRVPPLRLTPFQRPRRATPLVWGGLAVAAALLLLPALLASVLWPSLGSFTPFGGPPDRIPRGASAWVNATARTPLNAANASFGAQSYAVDPQFAAAYAARGGQSALGQAITPSFDSNLGLVQFFASGALLRTSPTSSSAITGANTDAKSDKITPDALEPELARDGDLDTTSGVEWLPLSHTLLTGGSAATIGGAGSALTYARLREATLPVALEPVPSSARKIKANAPLPQTITTGANAFVVEGSRDGKLVGHSIPASIWSYINQTQIAPHGWMRDIGEPLTEPISVTATGSDGQSHHLLAQAFWQTIIISDVDAPQATTMEPVGLDYLRTFGAPAAHPTAGVRLWTTQDGSLRASPGASAVAVGLNSNAPVTLTGAAQWTQAALWYDATWSTPTRHGSAWISATTLSATQPGGPTTAGFDALSPSLASYLGGFDNDAGAVVYDVTRNTVYSYQPSQTFVMASSAKVPLMVSYLTMIESQGRGPNGYELSEMSAMIEQSDNNAAQVIYDTIGYDSGEQGYMHSWGITDYTPDPNGWGWARWSPGDMAHLLTLLQQGKVLNSSDRALAFHLMESIESDQRFGVGDTAPAGATVAMKDGWVTGPDGAWAVNTSGIVTIGKETYIITVYTGEQNSFGSGQTIVNHVCGVVAQALK